MTATTWATTGSTGVIVDRLQAADPDTLDPVFLGAERRCPPEDCGSVPGCYEFLDAISGPDKES